jgi:DNA-binding LytR/AlgR family response regulator
MIRAIAIDDEPPALKVIEVFCSQAGFIELAKSFTKPQDALKYLHKFPADLIFLDIRMPSVTGLELCSKLPQEAMVIFTTAYSEYAVEGFNLNAVDYLLKPFTYERFLQAATKAQDFYRFFHHHETVMKQYLFVRADYSLVKIMLDEILYIEGLDDYLKIHLDRKKTVVARMTMKAMVEKLPAESFIRIHRSYIVPLGKIERVRNRVIRIGNDEIPLGGSYEEDFLKTFNDIT